MKITIIEKNKKILNLKLPNILFLNKIIFKYIIKKVKFDPKFLKENLKYLKNYIKKNGHFTLIEIDSDEDKIIIEV